MNLVKRVLIKSAEEWNLPPGLATALILAPDWQRTYGRLSLKPKPLPLPDQRGWPN